MSRAISFSWSRHDLRHLSPLAQPLFPDEMDPRMFRLKKWLTVATLAVVCLCTSDSAFGEIVFSLTTRVQSSVDGGLVGSASEISTLASGKTAFTYELGGVAMTMTSTGGAFSTNDFRFGVGTDQQIDDSGESVSFSFDTSGSLQFLAFGSTTLGSSESMILSSDAPALTYTLNGNGSAIPSATTYSSATASNWDGSADQFSFADGSVPFTPSTVFTLAPNSSGGGLAGIAVSVVPEPAGYCATVGVIGLICVAMHHLRVAKSRT